MWLWFKYKMSLPCAEIKQRGVTTVDEQVAISRKFLAQLPLDICTYRELYA